jgi:hypothetical protein
MKRIGRFLLRLAVTGLLTFVLLELGLAWLSRSDRWPYSKPSYRAANAQSRFWADLDPVVGVWHEPNSTYRHVTPCFDLTYKANSYGARDRERQADAEGRRRVVVLGDSQIEGYGVATEARLSDRLERITGMEHLNFSTAGSFGPLQYSLLYSSRAARFEHAAVLVGILPDNDFEDDDPDFVRSAHAGRYRPYLSGAYPDYTIAYSLPSLPAIRSSFSPELLARQFSYTAIVLKNIIGTRRQQRSGRPPGYSGYFDYTPAQWDRLRFVLGQLRAATGDRPLVALTIPCWNDVQRTRKSGTPPLPQQMAALCAELGIEYLDLLPATMAQPDGGESCYLTCDRHWSARGNELAAEQVLATSLYQTPPPRP